MLNRSRLFGFLALIVVLCGPAIVRADASVPVFTPLNPNPGLEPSQGWEGSTILQASVIFDQGQYKAWYTAGQVVGGVFVSSIGYATSNDGVEWMKYSGNPVLSKGSGFDSFSVAFTSVVKVDNLYYMYYRGYDGSETRIGLATSQDGITWTKYSSNPLFLGTQPNVVFANNQWNMWYVIEGKIYYVTSADGKAWNQPNSNVVGVPSGRINAYAPSTAYTGGLFHMWFSSANSTTPSLSVSRLFYATSNDGKSWNVYADDPLPGAVNIGYSAVVTGSTSYLWFNKGKGIYVATTTTPIPEFGVTGENVPLIFALTLALCFAYFVPRKFQPISKNIKR